GCATSHVGMAGVGWPSPLWWGAPEQSAPAPGDRGCRQCAAHGGAVPGLGEDAERDGEWLAEYGPGALLGERAHLEGGTRTSTLVAVTPCRVASVDAAQFDQSALMELSGGHRREDAGQD